MKSPGSRVHGVAFATRASWIPLLCALVGCDSGSSGDAGPSGQGGSAGTGGHDAGSGAGAGGTAMGTGGGAGRATGAGGAAAGGVDAGIHVDSGGVDAGSSIGVRRFFADSASWNRPISDFGESTEYAEYAGRFYDWAGGLHTETRGHFVPKFVDYSVPIYDAKTATTTARAFQVLWSQNQQTLGNAAIGTELPWNPAWQPGTANDRIMAVVDYAAGRVWELWVVGEPPSGCADLIGPNTQAGFDATNPSHLCIAGLNTYDNLWTATDGTTVNGRGAGINKLIGVTRADEVASGAIRHVLELTTTASMFGGPVCDPPYNGSAPGAGTDCGFYLPPATRVEWSQGAPSMCGTGSYPPNTPAGRAQTIPEGIRFGIHITDAEIETWLDSRGYTGPKRETARIFAVAWRDYGATPIETGCYGVGIETDGIVDPVSRAKWAALGITGIVATGNNPEADLLDGLVTRERLYVVNPPG